MPVPIFRKILQVSVHDYTGTTHTHPPGSPPPGPSRVRVHSASFTAAQKLGPAHPAQMILEAAAGLCAVRSRLGRHLVLKTADRAQRTRNWLGDDVS